MYKFCISHSINASSIFIKDILQQLNLLVFQHVTSYGYSCMCITIKQYMVLIYSTIWCHVLHIASTFAFAMHINTVHSIVLSYHLVSNFLYYIYYSMCLYTCDVLFSFFNFFLYLHFYYFAYTLISHTCMTHVFNMTPNAISMPRSINWYRSMVR